MNPPSPHPTEQLSSLLTREETPGSFHDHVPIEPWDVQAVSKEESASDTYLRSHTPGLEDCLTRLEEALSRMETTQQRTLQVLESLVDSLAEDDEDEPARYLDGRLV